MSSLKNKVVCWVSDRIDDIHFLSRKDVSVRFKLLNVLSGDRLRRNMAFPLINLKSAKDLYDEIPEYKSMFDGDDLIPHYEYIMDCMAWYIERANNDLSDIWQI